MHRFGLRWVQESVPKGRAPRHPARRGPPLRFQRPINFCVVVVAYFLAMGGISVLALKLSWVVTAKTIALSLPDPLNKNLRKPSRVEQRRIDVARAVPPMPVAKRVLAFEMPTVSYAVLAAQLDLAEEATGPTIPKHSAERELEKSWLNRLATELASAQEARRVVRER